MKRSELPEFLAQRLIAILRGSTDLHIDRVLDTLVEAGLRSIEITLTTPGALPALERARKRHAGSLWFGAGSLTAPEHVEEAADAGADFLVTPVVVPGLIEAAVRRGVPIVPGAFTATEIWTAWKRGATAVKVFPAARVGPGYLRDLSGPLPDVRLVPTGGVAIEDVPDYLEAGAVAVGVGTPLVGDALDGGSLDALKERCRDLLGRLR